MYSDREVPVFGGKNIMCTDGASSLFLSIGTAVISNEEGGCEGTEAGR